MEDFNEIIDNLKGDGITRRIDELGRIVVPVNFRLKDFEPGTEVYLYKKNNCIIISLKNLNEELGIRKTFDELGRIQINIDTRRELEWKEKDFISVWKIENYIVLKKLEEKCTFCESTKNLIEYKNKLICNKCKNEISNI